MIAHHPLRHILDWFFDVNPTGFGWGPVKVTYTELEAFSRLRKIDLRPWEAELIVDISAVNVEVYHTNKNVKSSLPKGYKQVQDPEGVKAMFSKIGKG